MVALELIKNLQKIDHKNEYVVFVKPDFDDTCIPSAPNFKVVQLESKWGYPGWEQIALPKAAYKEGMRPMRVSGLSKVKKGLTSFEEILKVTPAPLME